MELEELERCVDSLNNDESENEGLVRHDWINLE